MTSFDKSKILFIIGSDYIKEQLKGLLWIIHVFWIYLSQQKGKSAAEGIRTF